MESGSGGRTAYHGHILLCIFLYKQNKRFGEPSRISVPLLLGERIMKVVQINATCGVGSTGKICVGISRLLTEESIENYILYSSKSNGYEKGIKCSSDHYVNDRRASAH